MKVKYKSTPDGNLIVVKTNEVIKVGAGNFTLRNFAKGTNNILAFRKPDGSEMQVGRHLIDETAFSFGPKPTLGSSTRKKAKTRKAAQPEPQENKAQNSFSKSDPLEIHLAAQAAATITLPKVVSTITSDNPVTLAKEEIKQIHSALQRVANTTRELLLV